MINKKVVSVLEISLFISMTFAVSYELSQAFGNSNDVIYEDNNFNLLDLYRGVLKLVFSDKNFVSAAELQVNTCLVGKNGSICQEYTTANQCNSECNSTCIPAERKNVASCRIGTCYDNTEGRCSAGSPMAQCQNFGGQWFDDSKGNILQCQLGCCILGNEANLYTEQQCKRQGQLIGINPTFKGEIRDAFICGQQAKTTQQGACIFTSDFEKTCKFTTQLECAQKKGDFRANYLCSNPSFGTNCTKEARTSCVVGKDELYWFDSCGNKENIYEGSLPSQKEHSWNDGVILAKNNSCFIGTASNLLANQNTCGNCNYYLGSICGPKTSTEKLSDSTQNYVCKNLGCTDSNGKKRANGESWCKYDSSIGVDDKNNRATDAPGSRHFREVCSNGEVRIEPCQDYRNEICVQSDAKTPSGTFSAAACKLNQWQVCLDYNTQVSSATKNMKKDAEANRDSQCSDNEDCFIKNVTFGDSKFRMCLPKYSPGFDLNDNSKAAQQICSLATQKCSVFYVKGISGWSCKKNCQCAGQAFAQQMNNFCTSLGDCGSKANIKGDLTVNTKLTSSNGKKIKLDSNYLSGIQKYSNPVPGKFATSSQINLTEFIENVGIPDNIGSITGSAGGVNVGGLGMIAGVAGIGLVVLSKFGGNLGLNGILTAIKIPFPNPGVGITGQPLFVSEGASIHLSYVGGALAGAAIGLAVVSLLLKYLGIGRGLSPAIAYGLMGAGAVSGAIIGSYAATGQLAFGAGAAPILAFAWVLAIVVIGIIIVMKILGVGKTKTVVYTFSCNAWQPPSGGSKCNQCGDNGLPCSKYVCQSLGQTCEFINEGTSKQACVANDPKNINPPVISPNSAVLQEGYQYTEVSTDGVTIKNNENDGCIGSYTPVTFGIKTDKVSQCVVDNEHTESFDDASEYFGGDSLYDYNHTMFLNIPSIESLGLPGYDPNSRADYNLYVRCQDKGGHKMDKEYNIKFCVKPGIDNTAPSVSAREPDYEYVAYGQTDLNASVFTNEPVECKWSASDKDYSLMENNLSCANSIEDQTIKGWKCDTNFPVDSGNSDIKYYVRCQDQPSLFVDENGNSQIVVNEEDEDGNNLTTNISAPGEHRNAMTQSYVFNIKKSSGALKIDSITPNNTTIRVNVQPASINFTIKTSGGVDGKPLCSFLNGNDYIPFFNTWSNVHTQTLEGFTSGAKRLDIKCEDLAGNVVEESSRFNLILDTQVPIVTRAYSNSNSLTIITDENSQCYISTNNPSDDNPCNFNIANASLMTGSTIVHTSAFNSKTTSYIKCKDSFGNIPGDCSIKIRGAFT